MDSTHPSIGNPTQSGARYLLTLLSLSIALGLTCVSRSLVNPLRSSGKVTYSGTRTDAVTVVDTRSVDEMNRRRLEIGRKLSPTIEDIRESMDLAKRIGVAKGYWTKKEFEDFAYGKPGESRQTAFSRSQPEIPKAITPEKTPEQDQIVERVSADLPGLRRTALKVIIGQPATDSEAIRSFLLDVAARQDADVVLAYGYFQGEDWHTSVPAGILEYGKKGHGWVPGSTVPSKGAFRSREEQSVKIAIEHDVSPETESRIAKETEESKRVSSLQAEMSKREQALRPSFNAVLREMNKVSEYWEHQKEVALEVAKEANRTQLDMVLEWRRDHLSYLLNCNLRHEKIDYDKENEWRDGYWRMLTEVFPNDRKYTDRLTEYVERQWCLEAKASEAPVRLWLGKIMDEWKDIDESIVRLYCEAHKEP